LRRGARHAEDVAVLVEDDFCDERRVGALKGSIDVEVVLIVVIALVDV